MVITLVQIVVLAVICLLIYALYKEIFNPSLSFFLAAIALLLVGVLSPGDILSGLSNEQLIVIFLLILVTSGIRQLFGTNLFGKIFDKDITPKAFLIRMMMGASALSAFLNNTPIVAFFIPYVKEWSEKSGHPSSKFLIPLSFATILGGMITVIGTSTNLILMGLISNYNLEPLHFTDFLYLGMIVTLVGWAYFYFVGYRILPSHKSKIKILREKVKEYIVETELYKGSPLSGRSVKEAGLRNLQDLYLAEIIRHDRVISPVHPDVVLEDSDKLFFSGNTNAIFNLVREDNGIRLPKQDKLINGANGHFHFVEAVIPSNSDLIGSKIKDSDFRNKFNASIIAIHRNGRRVAGNVSEVELSGGDFLLLLSGGENSIVSNEKDLFLISVQEKRKPNSAPWQKWLGLGALAGLVLGATGAIPLFHACLFILGVLVIAGVLTPSELKNQLDFNLFIVLVCSLAIGIAVDKSGVGSLIALALSAITEPFGIIGLVTGLFVVTTFLTCIITNPAAVSMMFPIAWSMAKLSDLSPTPFFVAIAFAASGDFMTPIGYQTNLMVFGPGGYTFKDFLKIGVPLTILYALICITFITKYYHLV